MAQRGEAADYYSGAPQQSNYYQMQEPAGYPPQPPQYENAQKYGPPVGAPPPPNGQQNWGEKPSFEQTFKVEKPKYNDWWAGLLVCMRAGCRRWWERLLFY